MIKELRRLLKNLRTSKQKRRHGMVGPSHLWKARRDFQIKFLKTVGLTPEHYLLDLGCGTLRGGIPLIEYLRDGRYYGIEVRKDALDEGREELKDASLEHKNPTLLLTLSELSIDRKFDYIWAFSVLIHMTDDILESTLAFVRDHLEEEGALYANVNIGEMEEGSWKGYPVVARSLEFYRDACARNGLSLSDLGMLREYGHVITKGKRKDMRTMIRITRIGGSAAS